MKKGELDAQAGRRDLVVLVGGPKHGSWYSESDWNDRRAAAQTMDLIHNREVPSVVLQYRPTRRRWEHPVIPGASGLCWRHDSIPDPDSARSRAAPATQARRALNQSRRTAPTP